MASRTLQKRLWLNLALIILALGLLWLVIYEPGKTSAPELQAISTLQPDTIRRIAIVRPGKPVIRFENASGGWRMVEPRPRPANGAKLENLLKFSGSASQRHYPVDELDLSKLGLDENAIKLRLNDAVFVFGDTDAIHGWRYVRVDDTVHLIQDQIYFNLRQEPLAWVDTRLLPEGAKISGLELPNVQLTLNSGKWQLKPPRNDISADAAVELIRHWENTNALSVHPLDGSEQYTGAIRVQLDDRDQAIVFKLIRLKTGIELARADWGIKYRLTKFQRQQLFELKSKENQP